MDKEQKEKEEMDLKDIENMTEEELDKLLLEQEKLAETLDKVDENGELAMKIFEDIQKLSNSKVYSEEQYEEKSEQIKHAISDLNEKSKSLKDKQSP